VNTFAILAHRGNLPGLILLATFFAAPLAAQYPLAPSPVLKLGSMLRDARLSGYASVRTTLRDGTATTIVNRARITVQALPVSFAKARTALPGRLQAAPWLQPVVKWERLHETLTTTSTVRDLRLTWITYGINLLAPQERLRLQLNWIARTERPVERSDELVAQLQAIF